MKQMPLDQVPMVVGRVVEVLEGACDSRADGAGALFAALSDFATGRADAPHADRLARALADERVLFDLCEATAAAGSTEPGAAYRFAALRLLSVEDAVLRQSQRERSARPRHSATSWTSS